VAGTSEICGVWLLQSYRLENTSTGERIEPFGADPSGVLILLPEGRMAGLVTPSDRAQPVTEADQAEAFQKLIAYSGRFRLDPPDRFVTNVDVAWFQPWVGSQQARRYRLRDNRLDIVSDPTTTPLTGDDLVIGVLSWIREC
jgi:Lipocalin-like domain